MHWAGVAFALLIGVCVMFAVWRLIRRLEGNKTHRPWNSNS
jgi:hypothetical protein